MIRLLVQTNDTEPGDARHGERPYHSDQEMPERIREWFGAGLEDRDDGPGIVWFEARMRPGPVCDGCGHAGHADRGCTHAGPDGTCACGAES